MEYHQDDFMCLVETDTEEYENTQEGITKICLKFELFQGFVTEFQ